MSDEKKIYNFCIIAHIDHGKSTLADRFLEITGTIDKRNMQDQMLDSMDLEREKGITIKLQPVKMKWKGVDMNLIDTPGHVDFQYEVSRSLQAVEGAILLVDATQGVQAQTVSNLYFALAQNLTIIPVINKIDLPAANVEAVKQEIINLVGVKEEEILSISAKTGEGVAEVLDAVMERLTPAAIKTELPLRALIFDSIYDNYKGVVAYVRIMEGQVKTADQIVFLGTNVSDKVVETGTFAPEFVATGTLSAGDIGYIATGLKNIREARVGDTISLKPFAGKIEALPGFTIPQPKVFAGLYPANGDDFANLKQAMDKLQLNDASLTAQQERSQALGQGFRCGFLGMLHLEIVQERLKREFDLDVVVTTPSVMYEIELKNKEKKMIYTPDAFPDPSQIESTREQWCQAEIIVPTQYLGPVFEMMRDHEGVLQRQEYLGSTRAMLTYQLPMRELVVDLYDQLKSVTAGFGSLSYELLDFRPADVVKLTVLINHEMAEALSVIVPRQRAEYIGRRMVAKLKDVIPRQLFSLPLQAAVGGKVVARESLSAMRKDVTGHLYGGDYSRKKKLLEKQKKGKKKLASVGSVEIPSEAYIAILKRS